MTAYQSLPDQDLFRCEQVRVALPQADRPGHPLSRVLCSQCGEGINDQREVTRDGQAWCRACAGDRYYDVVD